MTAVPQFPRTIVIGDTDTLTITMQNSSAVPTSVAGSTFAMMVKATPADSVAVLTYTCAVVGDGTAGQFTCTASATLTAALSPQVGVYDVQQTAPGGVVSTIVGGPVSIVQDVTR
jgi:hypothetical protein